MQYEQDQPPSGGCVLKRIIKKRHLAVDPPAAFGRLCVETITSFWRMCDQAPAAFGRLCVETSCPARWFVPKRPAAFGRLCVETLHLMEYRLFAFQPPSGGCVLKHLFE